MMYCAIAFYLFSIAVKNFINMLSISLLFAVVTALLSGQSEAQYLNATKGPGYISYSTVTGYFLQDEPDTVASGFDYVC
jgi:protein-S-isoprenylcysteine O-methyltransferase Ste14